MARGHDGCDDALELKLRLFADFSDVCGGARVEQEEDHIVARYYDRAHIPDWRSLAPRLCCALSEAFVGAVHLPRIKVWPEALDQERGVRECLNHHRNTSPLRPPSNQVFPYILRHTVAALVRTV